MPATTLTELIALAKARPGSLNYGSPGSSLALEIANRAVTKEDLICITGSFYLVGEAKKVFAKMARKDAAEAAAAATGAT